MGGTLEAVSIYRDLFEPSAVLAEPYTIVTASAIAAATAEEAQWLAGPGRLRRYGLRTGRLLPLLPPDEAASHEDFTRASAMPSSAILGTGAEVAAGLDKLAAATGASELMIHTPTHGLSERLGSLELVATAWGLAPDLNEAGAGPAPPGRRSDRRT
jgi:alkanesulfonate monooxygenase SsuD/methylene tetrahydromethanopterin reductase-like flavin-dependent oxidoreductase (luciferase family)